MGIFEQHPWVLVPIIVLTIELWSALKSASAFAFRRASKDKTSHR